MIFTCNKLITTIVLTGIIVLELAWTD